MYGGLGMSEEVRRGWPVIAGLLLIESMFWASCTGTMEVFFHPLIREFAANHEQVARIPTVFLLMVALTSPVAGWLCDRVRIPWLMAAGALLAGGGLLLASQARSLGELIALYCIVGVGAAAGTMLPSIVLISEWFAEQRGLVIGIVFSGLALGLLYNPPLFSFLALRYGWRWSIALVGAQVLIFGLSIDLILLRPPPAARIRASKARTDEPGLELGAAIRTSAFWLLIAINFLFLAVMGAVYFHVVPFLMSLGFGAQRSATLLGLQNLSLPAGLIITGWAADRFDPRWVLIVNCLLLGVAVMGLMGTAVYPPILLVYMLFYASTLGATGPTVPLIIIQSLGIRRLGTINGATNSAGQLGAAAAAWLTGRLADATGGYMLAFELAVAYCLLAALCTWLVRPAQGEAFAQTALAQAAP
jgi:predicted MFS family arabinose efflux permease